MALFTDQNVSDISDLIAYEANLPEIAGAEGIDLATKVKLAQTEVGAELEAASRERLLHGGLRVAVQRGRDEPITN